MVVMVHSDKQQTSWVTRAHTVGVLCCIRRICGNKAIIVPNTVQILP